MVPHGGAFTHERSLKAIITGQIGPARPRRFTIAVSVAVVRPPGSIGVVRPIGSWQQGPWLEWPR